MSLPQTQPAEKIDWASLAEDLNEHRRLIEETKARLSAAEGQRFIQLFLDFTRRDPPSVPEAQATLRSICGDDHVLLSRYAPFLTHPASTPAECQAARQEFGRIHKHPMRDFPPPIPGWSPEEFFAAIGDRRGKPALERFVHLFNLGPRNTDAGIPTRPALLELLGNDAELLHGFGIFWPETKGDMWGLTQMT